MWRYFIPRWTWHQKHGTTQTLFHDDVERTNYALCAEVWEGLTEQEREVMGLIHSTEYDRVAFFVSKYADDHGMRVQAVWNISHRVGRLLAIRKGLVPAQKGGNF